MTTTADAAPTGLAPHEHVWAPKPNGDTARPDAGERLAILLAGVLEMPQVDPDANFFDDLGADSMLLAQFCARVRKQPDLPKISMKDVYANPTLRSLSTALALGEGARPHTEPATPPRRGPSTVAAAAPAPVRRPGAVAHFLCGTAQLIFLLGGVFLVATATVVGYQWVESGSGIVQGYLHLVAFLAAGVLGSLAVPLAAKWLLIGRWTPREFPAWGLTYFRFWVAKTVLQRNPIVTLMVGSPLYPLYLRALGARIGPGVAIFSRQVALCPDLFSVGAGTVVRERVIAQCYRAHDGMIQTGPVTLGRNVVVGEASVLDIDAVIGDDGQLGHASSLHRGQQVPAGQSWHGSPATECTVEYRLVPDIACSSRRRAGYATAQVLGLLLITGPLALGFLTVTSIAALWLSRLPLTRQADLSEAAFYGQALLCATVLILGPLLVGLVVVLTVPALLNRFVRPGQVHPLYGVQYALHRSISRLTNLKLYALLFGDSSAVVYYLQGIGYYLAPVVQTGTNFGVSVAHGNPFLVSVGTNTVVADGLMALNAEISSTSIRLGHVQVGARNFLGNNIPYPARGRTGDDCLLGTKVQIPIEGPVHEGVGLLGSPAFVIPRTVARDARLAVTDPDELKAGVAGKNRHNAVTFLCKLLSLCGAGFLLLLCAEAAAGSHDIIGPASFGLAAIVLVLVALGWGLLMHRAVAHMVGRFPNGCSVYDRAFWRHERYWKLSTATGALLVGTPMRPWFWRAMGARIGRRVLDDGFGLLEKSFATIGDQATLNAFGQMQTHSQEDGAFKSDHSRLGNRVTTGVGAFIHYGVTIEDGAVIAPDSFVMKGEEVPAHAYWGGNPAREVGA